jgi:4-phytase/acid phosphatase/peptide/nickel transport system substrate-binding protein
MTFYRVTRHKAFTAAILVTAAHFGLTESALASPKRGGTLTIASEAEFSGFNHTRARIFNQNTSGPALAVMETLFAYEGKKIVPRLATDFTEAPDHLSATVKLREGVKFHDGTPFNADAVVFHYQHLMAKDSGVNTSMLAPIQAVEKVDDHTVRFSLKGPWPALQSALSLETLINFIGSPTALKQDPDGFHRHPVGTGPFAFKSWQAGDRLTLERNPDYWDKELPYLDKVVFRILPDANTRYQSIRSGEVDIGRLDTANHVLDAKKDSKLTVLTYEGSGGFMWNFNHSKPPFNDPRARQAVVHAFNAKAMIDTIFLDTTTPTTDLLGRNSEAFCPDLKWRSYDLNAAKELVKSIGTPVKFELVSTNTPAGRRQAAMIKEFAKDAGMDANIRLVEQSQNVRVGLSGDYQMDVWRFSDIGGDPDLVLSYYFGGAAGKPVTRHDTTKIDALLVQARKETDPKVRHKLYCDIAQIFSDEAIALIPIRATYNAVSHPYVKDVPPMQNSLIRMRSIWLDK